MTIDATAGGRVRPDRYRGATQPPPRLAKKIVTFIWISLVVMLALGALLEQHIWAALFVGVHAVLISPPLAKIYRGPGWLRVALVWSALAAGATVIGYSNSTAPNGPGAAAPLAGPTPAGTKPASGPAPIGDEVFSPYVRAEEPEMFAQWGVKGVAEINRLRIAAAKQVAEDGACDRVDLSDLADDLSKAKHTPTVYVDCNNGQRFYFTKKDLGRPTLSETEKGARWTRQDAIDACTQAVDARLNIPGSMSRDILDTSAFQAEITGRWVVDFGFNARNGFGIKVPASAHCILMTDGRPEVHIVWR